MKFSVCIPNFNYARYLGKTIRSVLAQTYADFEILISDNNSTDGSLDVVRSFADPRIRVRRNLANVGFAGNLDRAASMATGEWIIMLSSDDLMLPHALRTYQSLFETIGDRSQRVVVSSSWNIIDADDRITGQAAFPQGLWSAADRCPELDKIVDGPVYRVRAPDLLGRCLRSMKNPFNFAATCYPQVLYREIEGYGGGRFSGPDKWFHWRLLTVADEAYFVDRPLFCYRWHPANQNALELGSGALKYSVDEYLATLEMEATALQQVGMTRDDLIAAFIEHDILNHGLATLARGSPLRAWRILRFGEAVYPAHLKRNPKHWLLRVLLWLGPLGQLAARWGHGRLGRTRTSPKMHDS